MNKKDEMSRNLAAGGQNQAHLSPFANAVEQMETSVNQDEPQVDDNDPMQIALKNAEQVLKAKKQDNDIRQKVSETTETGWYNVDMTKLAHGGRLYPSDLQLLYRAARAGEIRHWSNLDDNANTLEAAEHITDIITVCVRAVSKSGSRQWSYKDIYEHDKWKLLMLIHDVTFPEGSELTNPIVMKVAGSCKHSFEMNLTAEHIMYNESDESMDKYIDEEAGCFAVQTRSYGEVRLRPSTIGVSEAFKQYIATLTREQIVAAKMTLLVAQSFALDWRQLKTNKDVEKLCQSINAMDAFKELPLMLKIHEKCRVLPSDEIKTICPKCGLEGTAPFRFPEGIKQIFQPISDIDSELL